MLAILKLAFPKPRSKRQWLHFAALIACIVTMWGLSVSAMADDGYKFNVLNGIDGKFSPLQVSWGNVVRGYAQNLFWMLATIDFGWTTVSYVLDKSDLADVFHSLVKKIMTISFFWTLLKMSDTWIPAIINSFKKIGMAAAGAGGQQISDSTPDGIVSAGLDTALAAFQSIGKLGVMEKIAVVIPVTALAILIFLSFLFVAAQLLVTLIESYIAIGAGIILLGFGGSRWTTDMASKYLQYAVSTGVKLMVIYLIVGAGQSLFDNLLIDPANLIYSCLVAAGTAMVYAYLAISVPAIAGAMMSGSPTSTAGGMLGAAIGAGAAIAGAGAAAMAGGAGAASGAAGAAAGATGLAKALSAGLNSGLDMGKSGTELAAHALSEVGSHGLGLANGAIGDAVGSARTGFAQQVDGSAGGKIASSIEAGRGGSLAGIPVPDAPAASAPQASSGAPTPTSPAPQAEQGAASAGTAASQAQASGTAGTTSGASGSGASSTSTAGTAAAPSGSSSAGASPSGTANAAPPSTSGTSGTNAAPPPASDGAGSGAAPPPASDGSGTSSPIGSTESTGVPAPDAASSAPAGDASTASVDGGNAAPAGNGAGQDDKSPLHKRINELQGYVPQDAAHAASFNIDLSHTSD